MPKISLRNTLSYLLALFAFLLPWQTIWIYREPVINGFKWEFGTLGYYATEGLLWLCIFSFIVWYWRQKKGSGFQFTFTKDRIFLLFCLLFTVYCLLTTTWAPDPELAMQHSLRIMQAIFLFLMIVMGAASWKKLASWFIAGMTIQSLLGIWQFVTQHVYGSVWLGISEHAVEAGGTSVIVGEQIGRWLRAYGGFSHPNIFGGMLIFGLFLIGIMLIQKNLSKKHKNMLIAASLLHTTALFVTFSRSAWIAGAGLLIVAFGYPFLIKQKNKWKNVLIRLGVYQIALITVMGIMFFPLMHTRLFGTSSHQVRSVDERVSGYQEAINMIQAHPFIGVGAGNYTAALITQYPDREGWKYQPVHNVDLLVLAELGIIGVVLLIAMLVAYLRLGNVTYALGVLIIIACFLSLFDHYLYSSYVGMISITLILGIFAQKSRTSVHTLSTFGPKTDHS